MNNISHIAIAALIVVSSATSCGIYGRYKSQTPQEVADIQLPSYKEIFKDIRLQALVDTALVRNYNLNAAHQRVRQADLKVTASKLAYLPRIFAGANPAVTLSGVGGQAVTSDNLSYTFAYASWEIDIFGRLTNQKRISQATREQMADFEQAARSELIAAVASLYYKLQVLDAQIAAADSAVATRYDSYVTMGYLKQTGRADEAAVAQFEGSYLAAKCSASNLRLMRIEDENALKLLLCDENADVSRSPLAVPGNSSAVDCSGLSAIDLRAVRIRPDVRAAEMQLAGYFYNVNLARANCCPSIVIGGNVGWASGSLIYNAVGGLLQPIFNAGENIIQVKVSKSQLEEAQLNYANALLKAGTEVNNAIAARATYEGQLADNERRVKAMERALDATQLKMKLGRGTYLEVLISQNDLFDAKISAIQNVGEILDSYVSLFLALGGGAK